MNGYVFFIINGKASTILADESEIPSLKNQFGTMYRTFPEAKRAEEQLLAEENKANKPKFLTDEERKALEKEQIAYGRSQMTEEEKAEARQEHKSIDQLQWEFAMQMMGITNRKYRHAYA